jgi:nucleotide-binding universal stress UspA family protein
VSDEGTTPIDDDDEPLSIPEIDTTIERILCPVDGSEGSEFGLAWASAIATVTGAEILAVVACDPPVTIRRRGILEVEHLRIEMEEDAKEIATEAAELLIARGLRVRGIVVVGDPVESILQTAQDEDVDLIVMGRRGRGRLPGALVGSVSEKVARHAPVPVFLAN